MRGDVAFIVPGTRYYVLTALWNEDMGGWIEKPEVIGFTETQKKGIADGFGIARMREAVDSTNVKLGFHGVNGDGKPNTVIARAVDSGSSRIQPTHFFTGAVNSSRAAALGAIQNEFDDQIRQKMS